VFLSPTPGKPIEVCNEKKRTVRLLSMSVKSFFVVHHLDMPEQNTPQETGLLSITINNHKAKTIIIGLGSPFPITSPVGKLLQIRRLDLAQRYPTWDSLSHPWKIQCIQALPQLQLESHPLNEWRTSFEINLHFVGLGPGP
jgi:hypothetical protein